MQHQISVGSLAQNINEPIFFEPDRLLVESPTTQVWGSESDTDIVIAVMGRTGAGKSTLINRIVGAEQTIVGDSLRSCTQDMQPVEYIDSLGRRIILVDSPGFDDTHLSDLDILGLIATWLKQTYQGGKILSGLLYLHRISDNRMGNSPLRLLETFKNICGEDAFQNVILVTTMWDEVTLEEGNAREQELRRAYWKHMLALGARMERFFNTKESGEHIVSKFGPESRRPLLMQKEMVDEQKLLSETTAGRPFFSWLVGIINFIQNAVKALQRKLRWAKKIQRAALKEDIRQRQCFLEAANVHLRRCNTLPILGTQQSSVPALCSRLSLPCPELNPAQSTSSEPASSTSSTPSSPSDMLLSQHIDPSAFRTKSVTALKRIHQLLSAVPISGLTDLVEMVVKIGEMIEVTENSDDVLLSQFQDICNVTSSIIEAAQFRVNGPVEAIIDSFMTDMIEVKQIIDGVSSKGLAEKLHSEQSRMAINRCNHRLLTEGDILRLKGLVCGTRTTAMERLNLLIKQLRTQRPPCFCP